MNKRLILIFACFFAFNFLIIAQEITLTKSKLKPILCKRWQIEYAMMGKIKIGQKTGAADFDLKFNTNGLYDLINGDGKTQQGKWVYYADKKYIELSLNNEVKFHAKSIVKTKLILTLVAGKGDPSGLPQLEIHFKPY